MLQCEIIGNIGSDAEIRESGGRRYASFSVAHSERRKDADGKSTDTTIWVSVFYHDPALAPLLRKGNKVFVRGRLGVKAFTDRSGNAQPSLNVYAGEVQLCGIRQDAAHAPAPAWNAPAGAGGEEEDMPF